LEHLQSKIEKEYGIGFNFDEGPKQKILNTLKQSSSSEFNENYEINHSEEIQKIVAKLNLTTEDKINSFLKSVLEKSTVEMNRATNLKILYFNILNEIERMEKIKEKIESKATNRVTIYIGGLLLILIAQTLIFYHMIWNMDELGWDLVEPATYLFGSIVFMLGLFSFVKLHRNAISGEKIFENFRKNIMLKRFVRHNFQVDKYNKLIVQRDLVKEELSKSLLI
jgi:hypothetical protein